MQGWRRISDWKRELVLVRIEDIDRALIEERGWALPADRIAEKYPRIAALSRELGIACVEAREAKLLRARGITLHEFGYHRGSDGFFYRRTGASPAAHEGCAGELADDILDNERDEDTYDRVSAAVIDAILRVCSDGVLSERATLVAGGSPPLGPRDKPFSEVDDIERHEALGAEGLPESASAKLIASVRAKLAEPAEVTKEKRAGPRTAPAVKSANVRKALAWSVEPVNNFVLSVSARSRGAGPHERTGTHVDHSPGIVG